MLQLFTDEHVSPAIAAAVKKRRPSANIASLHDWRDGQFLGVPDVPSSKEPTLIGSSWRPSTSERFRRCSRPGPNKEPNIPG